MVRKAYGLSEYEHESFVCPRGNELFLPSVMKFQICHVCLIPILSSEADPTSVAGASRYLERDWIRWRGGFIDGRPACTVCQNNWRMNRRMRHVQA